MLTVQMRDNINVTLDMDNPTVGMGTGLVKFSDGVGTVAIPCAVAKDEFETVSKLELATAIDTALKQEGWNLYVTDIVL